MCRRRNTHPPTHAQWKEKHPNNERSKVVSEQKKKKNQMEKMEETSRCAYEKSVNLRGEIIFNYSRF